MDRAPLNVTEADNHSDADHYVTENFTNTNITMKIADLDNIEAAV